MELRKTSTYRDFLEIFNLAEYVYEESPLHKTPPGLKIENISNQLQFIELNTEYRIHLIQDFDPRIKVWVFKPGIINHIIVLPMTSILEAMTHLMETSDLDIMIKKQVA